MGPYYDYCFKFEGPKTALTKAQNAVLKLQAERKDLTGDGLFCNFRDPIQFSEDGKSMLWTYYTTDSDDAWLIHVRLKKAAEAAGLAFTYYSETTDGRLFSSIETWRNDSEDDYGQFDAALGMELAEVLLRWRTAPNSIDLAFLAMGLASAVKSGWGEDDCEDLAAAGQLRAEIVRTAMEFDLFSEPGCLGLLRSMKGCFDITREALDSEAFAGYFDPYEADYAGFDARMEEAELLAAVPAVGAARSTPAGRSRL
jgi:hypothetical protein